MIDMLPPARDLPPGRQARIRDELERTVGGRTRRRFVVPVLAGAAAVAAVTTSIVFLQPAPTMPTPAVQITSTSKAPDFGVPAETVAAIEAGCARSASTGPAKLHQLLNAETRWALLYTESAALTCELGVGGMEYNSGSSGTDVNWIPGHFSLDSGSASSGGDLGGKPAYAGVPGNRTIAGRVDEKVARLTYTVDGRTVEATVANGTFTARIYYPPSWVIPNTEPQSAVNAYDAAGTLLGTDRDLRNACFVNPETGAIVHGDRRMPPEQCKPATPWKSR